MEILYWRKNDDKLLSYMWNIICKKPKYKFFCQFTAYSTAFRHSSTRFECNGMHVVGKHWSYILFDFARLLSSTALLTIYLCFPWFCCAHIFQEDCFTDGGKLDDTYQNLVLFILVTPFLWHFHSTTFHILKKFANGVNIVSIVSIASYSATLL